MNAECAETKNAEATESPVAISAFLFSTEAADAENKSRNTRTGTEFSVTFPCVPWFNLLASCRLLAEADYGSVLRGQE